MVPTQKKYTKSISNLCKEAKDEVMKRRVMGKNALKRREKTLRVERKDLRRRKRAVKIAMQPEEIATIPVVRSTIKALNPKHDTKEPVRQVKSIVSVLRRMENSKVAMM